jgi:uncharacterized protein (TIGR02147 family)
MNSVQLMLNQKLMELQEKNPRLSHRYFAQKLGISSGALSEILKGKRKVSAKLASKLAARLNLDPITTANFTGQVLEADAAHDIDYLQLSDDQFHLISEWSHFAILNLVKSDRCQHKATWFAEQLNLPLRLVQDALDRLMRLGMLVYAKKKYIRSQAHFKTSDDVFNLSIRKSNLEDLELIREHLTASEVQERDFTSITMLIDPEQMPEFKKWIRKAQDQFAHKFETTKSANPFRLTMALYPLKKSKE